MWSQEVQKIFPDSLEVFLKNPLKIFHFLIFFQKVGGFSKMSLLQKMPSGEGWKHQKWPSSQKIRFLKVCDIDTTIQPGEKEGQTDVSSTLKMFYDHYSGFWDNLDFLCSRRTFLYKKPRKVVRVVIKNRKMRFFQKRLEWS